MERNLEFAPGEFYHVYSRGVGKQDIFLDKSDYYRFLKLLYLLNNSEPIDVGEKTKGQSFRDTFFLKRGEQLVSIGAYCLMPNHIHLLLKETVEGGISAFLRKLLTSHSMFFNKKYERVGPLFQSRFKACHASDDEYLRYLYAYIHLNPIKLHKPDWKTNGVGDIETARNFLWSYHFSSYFDYIGQERSQINILNKVDFPEYFQSRKDFKDYLDDWLNFEESGEVSVGPSYR